VKVFAAFLHAFKVCDLGGHSLNVTFQTGEKSEIKMILECFNHLKWFFLVLEY
jgi:hypothetical protein